ncbi:MAG: hypothetical protein JXR51_02685 [Bacteroidales bacterium]|nr:hypothetical protein [Bacteroidales bacterium]MBN2756055.1 hypothetical protein [Bacteroidales bacterium]
MEPKDLIYLEGKEAVLYKILISIIFLFTIIPFFILFAFKFSHFIISEIINKVNINASELSIASVFKSI